MASPFDGTGTMTIPQGLFERTAGGSPLGSILGAASPILGGLGGLPGFSSSSSASSAADSQAVISSSFAVSFDQGRVSGTQSNPDISRPGATAGASGPSITPPAGLGLTVGTGGGAWSWLLLAGAGVLLLVAVARRR